MDPVGLPLAVVPVAIQLYQVVIGAYNLYLDVQDFPRAYRHLQLEILIERHRLTLWANHVIKEKLQDNGLQSSEELGCWKIFEIIFREMLVAFEEGFGMMEGYQKSEIASMQPKQLGNASSYSPPAQGSLLIEK